MTEGDAGDVVTVTVWAGGAGVCHGDDLRRRDDGGGGIHRSGRFETRWRWPGDRRGRCRRNRLRGRRPGRNRRRRGRPRDRGSGARHGSLSGAFPARRQGKTPTGKHQAKREANEQHRDPCHTTTVVRLPEVRIPQNGLQPFSVPVMLGVVERSKAVTERLATLVRLNLEAGKAGRGRRRRSRWRSQPGSADSRRSSCSTRSVSVSPQQLSVWPRRCRSGRRCSSSRGALLVVAAITGYLAYHFARKLSSPLPSQAIKEMEATIKTLESHA